MQRKLSRASAYPLHRFFSLSSIRPISALIAVIVSFCIDVILPILVSTILSSAVRWAFLALSVFEVVEVFYAALFMASILREI